MRRIAYEGIADYSVLCSDLYTADDFIHVPRSELLDASFGSSVVMFLIDYLSVSAKSATEAA